MLVNPKVVDSNMSLIDDLPDLLAVLNDIGEAWHKRRIYVHDSDGRQIRAIKLIEHSLSDGSLVLDLYLYFHDQD